MNRITFRSHILQYNLHCVSNLRSNDWPHNSKVFFIVSLSFLLRCKGVICKFMETRFLVFMTDAFWTISGV